MPEQIAQLIMGAGAGKCGRLCGVTCVLEFGNVVVVVYDVLLLLCTSCWQSYIKQIVNEINK